ncbi:MAG TPA: GTPase ObgE [Candidatus Omnitrophota bacterium]|nr:GTPase ObgE [Candidatus Omnitrophota bacterium]
MSAFVDEARIFIKAGDGGKGCESFYQDLRTRYPRPDGGDGGRGGSVVVLASRSVQTLLDYKFRQHHEAQRGGHASSKNKHGKTGEDCILKVPVGTIVRDHDTGLMIKDLAGDGQSVVVARGGAGGIGNNKNRTPKPAGQGEARTIHFELKTVADVGLIGFPNAGKSTLISSISRVRSKIASYPFTTRQPILGFVQDQEDYSQFVVADLPGLIEGAHHGKGLGDRFLRHAERTRILVHVIDMAGVDGRDPIEDYEKINHELESYSEQLSFKKQIIVGNKIDLPESKENLKRFKKKIKGKIFLISALEKEGLDKLIQEIKKVLCREHSKEKSSVSLSS